MIAAGVCIVLAAGLMLVGQFSAAFVVAVLGLVSWFLNHRAQVSRHLDEQDPQRLNDLEGDDENEN